jgi:cytochrome P450
MTVKAQDPSIPDWFLVAWTASNVLAGSDTTAIMFRAIIYYLLKNPASRRKLEAELAQARKEGRLSRIVTWKESRELPYLDACIKEAGRIHPAIGLTLERVVPKGGAVICGERFEEGTIVGMSPWVVHRDKNVFGEDADEWNPDRWLCEKERRSLMERSLLTVSYLTLQLTPALWMVADVVWQFGAGHRTCLGKHVSYLEIYKLVPTLFSLYDVSVSILWYRNADTDLIPLDEPGPSRKGMGAQQPLVRHSEGLGRENEKSGERTLAASFAVGC